MGLLGVIVENALDSMFWGIIFTLLGVAILFFLIKGLYPKYAFTPISFIIGAFLSLLLAYHAILLCGAVKLKGMGNEVGSYLQVQADKFGDMYEFSAEESQYFCNLLRDEYPLFASYIGKADFSGHTPESLMYYDVLLAYGRYSGGNTVYNHLGENGARVIVLKENERTFKTWIRLRGGDLIHEATYPDSFRKSKKK